ncbi:MAG: DUF2269 family protein [Candidatus Sericytochromatia bacterium]
MLIKAIHLLGIILWTGGLMNLTRMVSFHMQEESEVQKRLHYIEDRIFKFVTLPGLILTLVAGFYMLLTNMEFYMKQPWMHAKLLFVGIMVVVTALLQGKLKELGTNTEKQNPKMFKMLHGITGLMLILTLVMIYVRPWARVIS